MVFVKVRETYDLHTTQNKMTVIAIHTPKPDILKRNYPGLLMQCKMYRPVSADVRLACASVLPLDPLGVGTAAGDVAPEDVFNPILYKAMSNKGMSQLEARINLMSKLETNLDVNGNTAGVDVDDVTSLTDEFNLYYGLLANTHEWKHANPQQGLSMTDLRPLVYEVLYNFGDVTSNVNSASPVPTVMAPLADGTKTPLDAAGVVGSAKPMPFMNCTAYEPNNATAPGFYGIGNNAEQAVPYVKVVCGCIIVPPSRLHEMFYRMVVEWTIEFTAIRSVFDIQSFNAVGTSGGHQHYQNYSYESTKSAVLGPEDQESILDSDSCMVSANVDVNKVM